MREDFAREIDADEFEGLPLRLVDSHRERWSNWKLHALHLER